MLQLHTNNYTLDLGTNTALTITMLNPLFDKDNFVRSFSYPFRLPATPNNLAAFEHINRLDTCSGRKYTAFMSIAGMPFDEGVLEIRSATQKEISVVFKNKSIDLLGRLKELRLRNLLDTVQVPAIETSGYRIRLNNGFDNYTMLINGNRFSIPRLAGDNATILQQFVISINTQLGDIATYSGSVLILKTEENSPLEIQILEGFTILEFKAYGVVNQDNMLAFAADVVTTQREDFAFPVMRTLNFYEDNALFANWINYYLDGDQIQNQPQPENEEDASLHRVWAHTYAPQVRLRYALKKIAEAAELDDYSGSWWEQPDVQQLLIYSNYALDELSSFFGEYITFDDNGDVISIENRRQFINGYKRIINLADHVPDDTADEFLKRITDGFNLQVDYVSNRLVLKPKIEQLQAPPLDYTFFAEPRYEQKFADREGFMLDFLKIEGETDVNEQLQPFQVSEGLQEIEIPFRPLLEIDATTISQSNQPLSVLRTVFTNTPGSSDETSVEEAPFRLFFDRGIQQDTEGRDYNMGSHHTLDVEGNAIGDRSLKIVGENGLYENNFQGYAELLDKKTVRKRFRLGIAQIMELRKWENARIYVEQPEGSFEGIVKQVQFQVSPRGMSVAELEVVSIV